MAGDPKTNVGRLLAELEARSKAGEADINDRIRALQSAKDRQKAAVDIFKQRIQQSLAEIQQGPGFDAQRDIPQAEQSVGNAQSGQQLSRTVGNLQGVTGGAAAQANTPQLRQGGQTFQAPALVAQLRAQQTEATRDFGGGIFMPDVSRSVGIDVTPNVLSPADILRAQLEQRRQAAIEASRLAELELQERETNARVQAESTRTEQFRVQAAFDALRTFGTAGAGLAAKLRRGDVVDFEDIASAGRTLNEQLVGSQLATEQRRREQIDTEIRATNQALEFGRQRFFFELADKKISLSEALEGKLNVGFAGLLGFSPEFLGADKDAGREQVKAQSITKLQSVIGAPGSEGSLFDKNGRPKEEVTPQRFYYDVVGPAAAVGMLPVRTPGRNTLARRLFRKILPDGWVAPVASKKEITFIPVQEYIALRSMLDDPNVSDKEREAAALQLGAYGLLPFDAVDPGLMARLKRKGFPFLGRPEEDAFSYTRTILEQRYRDSLRDSKFADQVRESAGLTPRRPDITTEERRRRERLAEVQKLADQLNALFPLNPPGTP